MTISSTNIKNSFSGNGSTSSFTYTFKITANSEMQVIIRSSTGTETIKSLGTHYNVSGAGNSGGGNVVFTSGNIPANGETVVLRRVTSQTQAMDLIDNDPMSAETIETAHDKSVAIAQELQEQIDRSLKLSRTNTMTSTEFTVDATNRAGKILAFDSAGEIAVTQELGTFKGNWGASNTYAVRDIVKDTSTNNIFIALTAHTSSGSQPLTTNSDSAKWSLLVDAATATTAQTAAANSATAASNSQTAAASSASTASTQATNASNSATAAASSASSASSSASAAQTAQAAAETALDTFDDRFLGAKSSDPTVDNDGNALIDGALYFSTNDDVMKVYDLTNTQWRQLTLTSANQTNVNTVAGQISPTNNIATVAAANTNISTLAGISNLNNLANAHSAVSNVSNNLSAVQNFADVYRVGSSNPTSSLNVGDLFFSTTANELLVYKSSGWAAAGSTVNGTSARFKFTASAGQTTFTGNDDNSENLAFDASFIDVYLNGVRLVNGTDCTVTSGNSIVLASGASQNDILEAVAFGTFNVAAVAGSAINSGTISSARLPVVPITKGGTGLSSLSGNAGKALLVNNSGNGFTLANASSAEVYGFNLSFVASTVPYTVTAASYAGSNKFHIMGSAQPTLELIEGNTYVFTYPAGHPFALSTTSDGSHGGGSEYTTGVTRDSSANTLTYVVPTGAPQLFYYCTSHSGMGGTANTPLPFNNNLQVTTTNQGQDNITNTQYAAFDDVLFSASGFSFSLSNGSLIATI